MPALATRFDPSQLSESGTARRPVSNVDVPGAEQWSTDAPNIAFEYIVGRRPLRLMPEATQTETIAGTAEVTTGALAIPHARAIVQSVVRLPAPPQPREKTIVLQKWEGTVLAVQNNQVTAVLRDLTRPSNPDEEAIMSVDEVPEADSALLVQGGVFYWVIGYKVTLSGNRERVSTLRFRRLPAWTKSEIREVERKARLLRELFG